MMRQSGMRREDHGGMAPVQELIPDKLYFRIGEVARICAVPSYVLRFWEREFPQLRPGKGGTGQRMYRRRDVEMALRVRRLLYDEGYTIPGARQWLREGGRMAGPPMAEAVFTGSDGERAGLLELRAELEEIARMLGAPERGRTAMANERQRHPIRRRPASASGTMPLFEVLEGAALGSGEGE